MSGGEGVIREAAATGGGRAPRRVLYGAACSLDGFIAGPGDDIGWLRWSDEVAELSAASLDGVDTIVMGRRTWEAARDAGKPVYPGYRNVVFSRTLPPGVADGVEVVAEDAVERVGRMRRGEGSGICVMGGGLLGSALLAAGLVDEVGVNVHPVLLGSGVPMFPPSGARADFELREWRRLRDGCFYALYRRNTVIGSVPTAR